MKLNSNQSIGRSSTKIFNLPMAEERDALKKINHEKYFDDLRPTVILLMSSDKERTAMQVFLDSEGNNVVTFVKVSEYEKWLQQNDFHILVIEVISTNDSNLIWLRSNQSTCNKGTVVVSCQKGQLIRLIARKAGADVFLLRPVSHDEMATVVRNLMYRMQNKNASYWKIKPREWLLISPENNYIKLTFSEKIILERLAQKPGGVVSKDIIAEALGYSPDVYDFRRLEIIIRRLRNKVQTSAGARLPLDTANRKGYSFTADIDLLD